MFVKHHYNPRLLIFKLLLRSQNFFFEFSRKKKRLKIIQQLSIDNTHICWEKLFHSADFEILNYAIIFKLCLTTYRKFEFKIQHRCAWRAEGRRLVQLLYCQHGKDERECWWLQLCWCMQHMLKLMPIDWKQSPFRWFSRECKHIRLG